MVGSVGHDDFKPVLDFEQGDPDPSYSRWIDAFLLTVAQALGHVPIFYSYSSYIRGLQLKQPVGSGLWLASYSRHDGMDYGSDAPYPWKTWDLHQFSANATVAGVAGHVDLTHAPTLTHFLANAPAASLNSSLFAIPQAVEVAAQPDPPVGVAAILVDKDGNVGIGNSQPLVRLDVGGDSPRRGQPALDGNRRSRALSGRRDRPHRERAGNSSVGARHEAR